MSKHLHTLEDKRQSSKITFSLHDVIMSAFACMYFQDPSIAEFQRRMEKGQHQNNLRTLFAVEAIPKDTQLRDILDTIDGASFAPIFKVIYERLRRHKHLEEHILQLSERWSSGALYCAIDGTQYHSSKTIHCQQCLHKTHRNGEATYSHQVLQGAIMHPDKKQVIPVMPEAIQNSDGTQKQDCESNAVKRFVQNLKKEHPRQRFIIGGDGLMSRQPTINTITQAGMHHLLVAKPGDHTYLFEWIEAYTELPTLEVTDEQGRTHHYRWQNQVPLNGQENAIDVNFLEYTLTNKAGKITYRNSWVTDIKVTRKNIRLLVKTGRSRWKIENECFNTLKNQGYHIEHNYGHGEQYLSYNMYLLTLLAFLFHQVFELTDGLYQACRTACVSKHFLWERLRGKIDILIFESWEQLLDMTLNPDDYEVNALKKS